MGTGGETDMKLICLILFHSWKRIPGLAWTRFVECSRCGKIKGIQ